MREHKLIKCPFNLLGVLYGKYNELYVKSEREIVVAFTVIG